MRSLLGFLLAALHVIVQASVVKGYFEPLNILPELSFGPDGKTLEQNLQDNAMILRSVRRLTIDYTGLRNLTASTMNRFPKLEILILENNMLEEFEPNTFRDNNYLTSISLAFNQIKNLSTLFRALDESPVSNSLKILELSINKIEQLEPFPELKQLSELYLAGNQIKYVDGAVFSSLKSLQLLNLMGNEISVIEPDSFSHFNESSRRLSVFLQRNNLSSLQDIQNAFRDAYIGTLNLAVNNIQHLVELESRFKVSKLIISSNKIASLLPFPIFKNNSDLEELQLEKNLIQTVEAGTFSNLNLPIKLSLAFNRIINLDGLEGALIKELDLSGTRMHKLKSLPRIENLKSLSLHSCDIIVLEPNLFDNLTNLRSIVLTSNYLRIIQPAAFIIKGNQNKLRIDLSTNKLGNFSQLMIALDEAPIEELNLENTDLSSLAFIPPMPHLKNISLSYNNLYGLDRGFFRNAPNLERIDLISCKIDSILPEFIESIKNVHFLNLGGNNIQAVPMLNRLNGSALSYLDLSMQSKYMIIDDFAFERKAASSYVISPLSVSLFRTIVSVFKPKAFCSNFFDAVLLSKLEIQIDSFKRMNKCHLRQLRGSQDFSVELALISDKNTTDQDIAEYCGCGYTRLLANKYHIRLTGICTMYPYVSCEQDLSLVRDDCDYQTEFRCPLEQTPTTTGAPTTTMPSAGLSPLAVAAIVIGSALLLVGVISLSFIFARFK